MQPNNERRAASNNDMTLINGFALKELTRADVAIFRLQVINDQIDRHLTRFALNELPGIARLAVGKPLTELHDMRDRQPRGRIFRAFVQKTGNVTSVMADIYILREPENESFIRNIEAGIYAGTSIGFAFRTGECSTCGGDMFTCPHLLGQEIDGKLCHMIMRDVFDVFEVSVVPLGSQSTEFVEARANAERCEVFHCEPCSDEVRLLRLAVEHGPKKVNDAAHEAGHLVTAHLCGFELTRADIVSAHGTAGQTLARTGERPREADLVAYSLAGDEAAREAGRKCAPLKHTEAEYRMMCSSDIQSAADTLDELERKHPGHSENCQAWGIRKAQLTIEENYSTVLDVAELLLQRRDVTGDEVRATLWSR